MAPKGSSKVESKDRIDNVIPPCYLQRETWRLYLSTLGLTVFFILVYLPCHHYILGVRPPDEIYQSDLNRTMSENITLNTNCTYYSISPSTPMNFMGGSLVCTWVLGLQPWCGGKPLNLRDAALQTAFGFLSCLTFLSIFVSFNLFIRREAKDPITGESCPQRELWWVKLHLAWVIAYYLMVAFVAAWICKYFNGFRVTRREKIPGGFRESGFASDPWTSTKKEGIMI